MDYIIGLLTIIAIFTLLTQSYNLVLGFAGQFHLAHIAFMGIGAYTFGLLAVKADWPFLIAMLAGGIMALIAGVFLGKITLPFKGPYLVIISYGFTEIAKSIELNWIDLTNGSRGLLGVPRPSFFGFELYHPLGFLIFTLVVVIIGHYLMHRIISSPYGLLLEALREDEIAVETTGRSTVRIKMEVMAVSAFFAGLAGALFVSYLSIITPEDYGLPAVILILLMVLLGGKGSFWGGGILGTVAIYVIFEPLRFLDLPDSVLGSLRMLIYAVLFILLMLLRPQGLIGRKALKVELPPTA